MSVLQKCYMSSRDMLEIPKKNTLIEIHGIYQFSIMNGYAGISPHIATSLFINASRVAHAYHLI